MNLAIEIAIIFGIWAVLLYLVKKKGGEHFVLMGPLIMWKTEKGKRFIDSISRKKLWRFYGNAAIIVTAVAMILTTTLVIWNVYIAAHVSRPISPRLILGIPGINPVIPIGYGIIALAIAIIFHEFSHGILARFASIKINSLGLLFLILPVGAFVEPDEEELMKVEKIKRARVFSAGPSTNIIIAVISLLLLAFVFSPAIAPKEKGVIVGGKIEEIEAWSIIREIDDKKINDMNAFKNISNTLVAGRFYNISYSKNGKIYNTSYLHGIIVLGVVEKSPAYKEIKKGYVIYEINGKEMNNVTTFEKFMETTEEGEIINISYYYEGSFGNLSIKLADKYKFTKEEKDRGRGFIGIATSDISKMVVDPLYFPNLYNPFKTGFFSFISLPFHGLSPFPHQLASLYNVPMPSIFWPLLNFIYWLFWLDFALGTFNALPALPLDGGYVFRDGIRWLTEKLKIKKSERVANYISSIVSSLIIMAIFAIILLPNIHSFLS